MELSKFLRLRDRVIKNEILRHVPLKDRDSMIKALNLAFKVGSRRFSGQHLRDLIGERAAKKLACVV